MRVFADTSALLKLYVVEPNAAAVRELAAGAMFAVCRIAWAEAMAAFARRAREVPTDDGALLSVRQTFSDNWERLDIVEVSQSVVERAGEYADTFALRAYDAVQLAAAAEFALFLDEPLGFACFDLRLNKAARALGMQVAFMGAR